MMAVVSTSLILGIAIGVLSTFGALVQEKRRMPSDAPPPADVQYKTPRGLQLVARTEKATFTTGESILLSVFARNNGTEALFIVDTYHPEWDTKFDVRNEADESANRGWKAIDEEHRSL